MPDDRGRGRRSRAARRAEEGDAAPTDDVLARLGIRAPDEGPAPWLEHDAEGPAPQSTPPGTPSATVGTAAAPERGTPPFPTAAPEHGGPAPDHGGPAAPPFDTAAPTHGGPAAPPFDTAAPTHGGPTAPRFGTTAAPGAPGQQFGTAHGTPPQRPPALPPVHPDDTRLTRPIPPLNLPQGRASRTRSPGAAPTRPAAGANVGRVPARNAAPPTGTPTPDTARPTPERPDPTAVHPVAQPEPAAKQSDPAAEQPDPAADRAEQARRIDASLTRLTAAHRSSDTEDEDGATADPADEPAADRRVPRRRVDRHRPVRRSRFGPAGRVAVSVLAALVLLATAGSWGATRWMDSTIRPVAALEPDTGVVDAEGQVGDENLLLLGTASGTSGLAAGSGDRADTLMLTHLPAGGGPVVAVAFPLTLEINRPPCPRWDAAAATYLDETVPAETRTPLSTAYSVGGPRCLVRTVQQLSGLAVTRFVALDLPGLAGMVDALGGVEMCLERPVAGVPAGTSRWDGAQAAAVAEAPDDSGVAQVHRQQRLLAATFGEALSTSTLLSPFATRDFAAALGRSMLADGTGVQDMLRLTSALEGAALLPLPVGSVPNTRGNLDLRTSESNRLFSALRKHEPVPEVSTPVATASGPEPGDVTVNVLNAADRTGLAGQVSDSLRALGFGVGTVGNATDPSADTLLRFSPDRADAADLLGRVVPAARLVQDPAGTGTLQLVLGTSFDGTVRAPVAESSGPVADPVSCD